MKARKDRSKSWPARKSYRLSLVVRSAGTTKEISVARSEMQTTPESRVELEPSGSGTGFTNFQPYTTNKLSGGWLSSCCCVSWACSGSIRRVAMGDKVKAAHLMVVAKSTTSAPLRRFAGQKLGKLPTSVPIRPRPCISAPFSSALVEDLRVFNRAS